MTDKPRRRSGETAELKRDRKDRECDAELAEDVNEVDDPTIGEKAEEERTLLEELAEYEPRTAYD